MSGETTPVDVLAVGAHPDDVEIGCGGLLARLVRDGHSVALADLTAGETGTRGTVEERRVEAANAARVLGVCARVCAGLPDGGVANTPEQQRAVIQIVRRFRPKVLVTLMDRDRHPDHSATHVLVREANFLAGLARIETGQPAHRTPSIYYFHPYTDFTGTPDFLVDVTDTFDTKLAALAEHKSQFHNPDHPGEQTYISSPEFWEGITVRARYWGGRMGVRYAEPFFCEGPLLVDTLPGLKGTAP